MNLCLFFQQLDLISERPTLLINKNERIKSVWGAFLTIILIALIISFAVNFLIELFGRKNPRLLIYDEMIEKFKTVPLDYENFPIFWSILDSDVESKGEIKNFNSYFETSIILRKYNENGVNFENVPVVFSKCTFENQLLVYRDIFPNNYGVENFNCLKYDKFSTNNPDLKSKISFDIKNTYIFFSLKICNKNGNPNASCTPPDANFISKINNSKLKFYFGNIDTNFNIKTESRENPVNKSPIFFSQVLSSTMKYSWDFNLINKRYSTDYGYIFSEIDNYEFYTIDKNYKIWSDLRINGNSTDSTDSKDLEVLSFTLGINNLFRPVYFRTFYKGQNFFAELGGVFNFLFVIAYHLNLVYSAVHLNLTIDNKCKLSYFVEKENNYSGKKISSNLAFRASMAAKEESHSNYRSNQHFNIFNKTLKAPNIRYSDNLTLNHIRFKKLYTLDHLDAAISDFRLKVRNLNQKSIAGTWEMVFRILCCDHHSKQREVYTRTLMKIKDYLDVNNIIKHLIEFEFLKRIIFSKNMLEVFKKFSDLKNLKEEKIPDIHMNLRNIYEHLNNPPSEDNNILGAEEKVKDMDHYAAQFFIENFMRK